MIDYYEVAKRYKPDTIRALLIGEAPPPSGKYFYVPKKMSLFRDVAKDSSLPATIFNHYFGNRPANEGEYENYLMNLKSKGIFLVDIVDKPLKVRDKSQPGSINQKNLDEIISEIPNLRKKLNERTVSIDEQRMIFLLPRLHYKKDLVKEFPHSQLIRWKDFRMKLLDCMCCA